MAEFREQTERLVLRDWREDDWPHFFRHTNTPVGMRWLGGVLSEERQQAFVERMAAYDRDYGHTFWACERKADGGHLSGELLGMCGMKKSNQEGGPIGLMEIGWRLRQDAWGHGYAREAATACLDLCFTRFGVDEVIALTVQENEPSWGLMLRLGMTRREDLDFRSTTYDPAGMDNIAYSISREHWERTAHG